MPALNAAPALPECVTVIICGTCGANPFTAAPDRTFVCPCGHSLSADEIDLGGEMAWAVTSAGLVALLPDPAAAWERFVEARTVMENPGMFLGLEDAHRAFLAALGELEAARILGLRLPDVADAQIGRVFLACSLNPDGTYSGSTAWALGWPCEACSPRATDPYNQKRYPCRNPRGHAWGQVRDWERYGHRECGHIVRSPLAPDLDTARRKAAEKCAARAALTL